MGMGQECGNVIGADYRNGSRAGVWVRSRNVGLGARLECEIGSEVGVGMEAGQECANRAGVSNWEQIRSVGM